MDTFILNFVWALLGMVVGWILKPAYEGFARRKGEIVAELTHARELEELKALGRKAVDQDNETHKAQLASRNSMRAASLDKRLDAHQAAFSLWWELRNKVHGDEEILAECISKCQSWWVENCLYLDPNVREDFSLAYSSASFHRHYVTSLVRDKGIAQYLEANWARIMAPGKSLPSAVELPSIAEDLRDPSNPIKSNVVGPKE